VSCCGASVCVCVCVCVTCKALQHLMLHSVEMFYISCIHVKIENSVCNIVAVYVLQF